MAYNTTSKRIQRVIDFLGAVEHPALIAQLTSYGLDQLVIDQGWTLLREMARARPGPAQPACPGPDLLAELDAWENRWLAIADATLRQRHAEVHRQLFAGLPRTRGIKLIVTIGTFVDRLRQLERSRTTTARAAMRLLQRRGLGDTTLREAETLLATLQRPEARPPTALDTPTPAAARTRARETEQALWNWYREWSQITRAAIHDSSWLRHLGFGVPGRPKGR